METERLSWLSTAHLGRIVVAPRSSYLGPRDFFLQTLNDDEPAAARHRGNRSRNKREEQK